MKITKEQIDELQSLAKEKKETSFMVSEKLRTYQDRNNTVIHKIEREGKEIEIPEKILWQELYHLGFESQAGEIIKTKYPDIYEGEKKNIELSEKLNKFTAENWGFFYNEMSLSLLIDLVNSLIDYKNDLPREETK